MLRLGSIVMVVGAVAGCTERVNVCHSDSECTNPAFPFCDVNGEYDESGHTAMSCSIEPANCPIERCGCTPGQVTCSGETLATCNAAGTDATTETCALGCAADGLECQIFDPSNGLRSQLLASADSPDVSLPDGTTIDTTNGIVKIGGVPTTVDMVAVPQASGPSIRVLLARSWIVGNVRVTGSMPLALVSVGAIAVNGVIDGSAAGTTAGPGSRIQSDLDPCVGQATNQGGGGGGNATAGGTSSQDLQGINQPPPPPPAAGGSAVPGLAPFIGGCAGGIPKDTNGNPVGSGAPGGGAIQLVSLEEVSVVGTISLGGAGGLVSPGGGGSGGNLILEAPHVRITGEVFVNGGSGAACGVAGVNGYLSTEPAAGPTCTGVGSLRTSAGSGGTGVANATGGGSQAGAAAGGGGAVGRVRVSTLDGAADLSGASLSAKLEQTALVVH